MTPDLPPERPAPWLLDPIGRWTRRGFRARARAALAAFLAAGARVDLAPRGEPDISVVLVLYGQAHLTLQALLALAGQNGICFETILVDNASVDETPALLAQLDGAVVLRNRDNLGFLAAADQGARRARGRAVLFLNNDAFVRPHALARALARLDADPTIGAVAARLVGVGGRLQEAGPLVFRSGFALGYGGGRRPDAPAFRLERDVDFGCGAFLLTRKVAFDRVGGFDPAFRPAYYEETDYCFRLRREGLRTVYDPSVRCVHLIYGSARSLLAPLRQMARNRALFAARHADALARRPVASLAMVLRTLLGLRPAPWLLIAASAEQGTRAAELARLGLDRGLFVSVRMRGQTPIAACDGFAQDSPSPDASATHAASRRIDLLICVDVPAAAAFAAAFDKSTTHRPPVVLDTISDGADPDRAHAALREAGFERIASADAAVVIDQVGRDRRV